MESTLQQEKTVLSAYPPERRKTARLRARSRAVLCASRIQICKRIENHAVLRRHSVELTDTLLPIEILDGAQVGVQLVDNAVDIQIGKPGIDLLRRINPERKWNTLAAVELLQPLVEIVCVPDLHLFREGRVGQYVNNAGLVHIA